MARGDLVAIQAVGGVTLVLIVIPSVARREQRSVCRHDSGIVLPDSDVLHPQSSPGAIGALAREIDGRIKGAAMNRDAVIATAHGLDQDSSSTFVQPFFNRIMASDSSTSTEPSGATWTSFPDIVW